MTYILAYVVNYKFKYDGIAGSNTAMIVTAL